MTDVFDETPTIVDGDVLEAAKENIQPLAKGRRVTALAGILSTPHAQRESRLSAARNRHRINVEVALEDEDDDPLEAYCRFVNWTVENYPQGHSAESGLLELLEEATRVLKDDRERKWRDDIRYLKLWVLYANYVEKPAIIYKFCLVNDIGTSHSLLYEEYATVLERASRRAEADEAYMLGIARKADPLERLENKHREFQKRMMASINLAPPVAAEPSNTSSSSSSRRLALAETASSSTSSSSRTRSARSGSTRARPAEDVFSPPATTTSAPRPNGRIPVFVDPAGDAENDPDQASPWPELGTRKARIKENIPEVQKAQGTKLRQPGRSARSGSGTSRIAVYRDPAPSGSGVHEEMPPPHAPSGKKEKGKSSIPVFRDEDAGEGSGSAGAAPKKEKGESLLAVFRDEDAGDAMGAQTAPGGKKPDKGKSSIAVFRDEEQSEKGTPEVPSTPSFTPFRDDEPATPSSSNVPASVMKPRREALGLTESEALRRDPLKNYAPEERPEED